jgi:hypothetical protein
LFARGVTVTDEAIRRWCRKFGQPYADQLRQRRPRPGDKRRLDEVFLTIQGECPFAQGAHLRPPGDYDRQTGQLWGGETRAPTEREASAAPLSERSGRKLPPTHEPTGTTQATLQVARARPTVSRRLGSDLAALPTSTALAPGPHLPRGDAATLPELAGNNDPGSCHVSLIPDEIMRHATAYSRERTIS